MGLVVDELAVRNILFFVDTVRLRLLNIRSASTPYIFYIYRSVHRNILWNNQQMQQCAVKFISLQVHSTCFGRHTRPSSGVQF